jgi:hypothetical protein
MSARKITIRFRDRCPGTGKVRTYSWTATRGCADRAQAEAMARSLFPRAVILPPIQRKAA